MNYYTYASTNATDNTAYFTFTYAPLLPPAPPAPLVEAAAVFGLTLPTTWEAVEKAYRPLAKKNHPDLGGDPEAMKAINNAYNLLKSCRQ